MEDTVFFLYRVVDVCEIIDSKCLVHICKNNCLISSRMQQYIWVAYSGIMLAKSANFVVIRDFHLCRQQDL